MEIDQDIRWKQRLSNFSRALSQLEAAVLLANQRPLSELEKQGMIRDRNRGSHTYNAEVAQAIVTHVITTYIHRFKELQKTFEGLAHETKA